MWKTISRYIREPIEQKFATNNESKTKKPLCVLMERNAIRKCGFKSAVLFQFHNIILNKFALGRRNEKADEKQKEKKTYKNTFDVENDHSFLEAFGLSSALAFGWTLSQNFQWKKKKLQKLLECSEKVRFKTGFTKNVLAHPALTDGTSFEPKAYEKEIEEATDELRAAHDTVISELENRLGLRCMQKKKYRQAVVHFAAASALKNAAANFYLGQCHELGLGTKQDFKKAASYYTVAADLGHPSAMYNLAVFYAHSWGGLPADSEKSRMWMELAAECGQPDAQRVVNPKRETSKVSLKSSASKDSTIDLIGNLKIPSPFFFEPSRAPSADQLNQIFADLSSSSTGYSSSSRTSVLSSNFDYPDYSADYYSGLCYENGFGVKQDLTIAEELYCKAAANGDSNSLYNLASSFQSSASDMGEYQVPMIMDLYNMAARKGHPLASRQLEKLQIHQALGMLDILLNKQPGKRCTF